MRWMDRGSAAILSLAALAACGGVAPVPAPVPDPAPAPPSTVAAERPPANEADVAFMTGMIAHHAQALVMARMAPSHGASPAIRTLAERIIVGQEDEIALMQRWLRDWNQPVPSADAPMDHSAHGAGHAGMMPGMLTADQMAQLEMARDAAFDRHFLTFMIQHHKGALTMVDQLFGSQGAAQDEPVFKIASGVYADQSTEIERMEKMLTALPVGGPRQ